MALQPWVKGLVIRIENETHNTRRYWIQLPEYEQFDFKPGQFVTLDLPIHEKPNKRIRSYSIASWPDGTNIFELLIVLLDGGAGTTYLFNNVSVGTELILRGPQGVFVLPDPIETDLFFICTGTGIAPFRSMVHHIQIHQVSHKNIYLLFGTRVMGDLLYLEEMRNLQKEVPGFYFLPTLSREKWEGHHGYVHALYENLIQQHKGANNELPAAKFYLCGWKNMVDEAKQRIQQLGYERKCIHQELYG